MSGRQLHVTFHMFAPRANYPDSEMIIMPARNQRLAMIETAFLKWLHQQTELRPTSGTFCTEPAGIVGGVRVTDAQLWEALEARGLIIDEGRWMGRVARVNLTTDGKLCLIDHGGDVRAWQAAISLGNVTSTPLEMCRLQ